MAIEQAVRSLSVVSASANALAQVWLFGYIQGADLSRWEPPAPTQC